MRRSPRPISIRCIRFVSALLAAVLVAAPFAHADVLVLKDGREFTGELIERTTRELTFATFVHGLYTTITVPLSDVEELAEEPGNQLADAAKSAREDEATASDRDRSSPAAPERDAEIAAVVIPLRGSFGVTDPPSLEEAVVPALLRPAMDEAKRHGASIVILEIDSLEGDVDTMNAICERLAAINRCFLESDDSFGGDVKDPPGAHHSFRLIAFVRNAVGPSMGVALTCPDVFVHPEAFIGAAPSIGRGSPIAEGASPFAFSPDPRDVIRHRRIMESAGRSTDLLYAFLIPGAELWRHPHLGFSSSAPDPSSAAANNWTRLDGPLSIYAPAPEEAVRHGIARGLAESPMDVMRHIGRAEDEPKDLAMAVERERRELGRRLEALNQLFLDYPETLAELSEALREGDTWARRRRAAGPVLARLDGSLERIANIAELLKERGVPPIIAPSGRPLEVNDELLELLEEQERRHRALQESLHDEKPSWTTIGGRMESIRNHWGKILNTRQPKR